MSRCYRALVLPRSQRCSTASLLHHVARPHPGTVQVLQQRVCDALFGNGQLMVLHGGCEPGIPGREHLCTIQPTPRPWRCLDRSHIVSSGETPRLSSAPSRGTKIHGVSASFAAGHGVFGRTSVRSAHFDAMPRSPPSVWRMRGRGRADQAPVPCLSPPAFLG